MGCEWWGRMRKVWTARREPRHPHKNEKSCDHNDIPARVYIVSFNPYNILSCESHFTHFSEEETRVWSSKFMFCSTNFLLKTLKGEIFLPKSMMNLQNEHYPHWVVDNYTQLQNTVAVWGHYQFSSVAKQHSLLISQCFSYLINVLEFDPFSYLINALELNGFFIFSCQLLPHLKIIFSI